MRSRCILSILFILSSWLDPGQAVGTHLARQLQHALPNDVLLDLGRAGVDRAGPRPEEVVGPGVLTVSGGLQVQRHPIRQPREHLAERPKDLLDPLLVPLVHLAVVQLVDGRLWPWPLSLLEI